MVPLSLDVTNLIKHFTTEITTQFLVLFLNYTQYNSCDSFPIKLLEHTKDAKLTKPSLSHFFF